MDLSIRLKKLQSLLSEEHCDCLLVEDPIDIFYMSGMELSRGTLLVTAESASLFVDGRYSELGEKSSHLPVLGEDAISDWLSSQGGSLRSIAFDPSKTSYFHYIEWQKKLEALAAEVRAPKFNLVVVGSFIKSLRQIKSPEEIVLMRQAADLGSEGYRFLLENLQVGVSERELAIELEVFWKRKGGRGVAFDPIVAFGANSSMPHYRAGDRSLALRDIVLIDIGVNWKHYHSDMTRTHFFGAPDQKLKEIYDIVLEAQRRALELCCPGRPIVEIDAAARDYIAVKGYGHNFTHSLGHGIGLEVHELPFIKGSSAKASSPPCLEEGMVITIEPGIYLPQIGGVRIEDSILIVDKGYENLTRV